MAKNENANREWEDNVEVRKDEDGVYRWYYALNLLKNPTILFLIWKIFFWIFVGIFVMINLFDLFGGRFSVKNLVEEGKFFGIFLLGMLAFVAFCYFIYAAINGFHYRVVFEMDEEGVTHTQVKAQFKKNQKFSFLLILLGIFARRPSVVGQGLLTATHQSMRSSWDAVTSVEIIRKFNVIKVNERLFKNQVYARDEDFDFVVQFIRSHVTKKCRITD